MMPGFAFKRVDAIVRKTDNRLHEPQRIRGALNCALEDARNRQGHMFLPESDMVSRALGLLNAAIPVPQLRLNREETETELQNMVLHGEVVSQNGNIFQPKLFDQEDTVARLISERVAGPHEAVDISGPLERVKQKFHMTLSEKQEEAVRTVFRSGLSINGLNQLIREHVNPYRSEEEEIKLGGRSFRVGDRIMQTKNTEEVSNGDLGFIRGILEKKPGVRAVQVEFNGKMQEYDMEDLVHVELAYATTIHKAMGSEYGTVIIPVVRAHSLMWYRNLLYTAVTRAKRKVILVGEKAVLFMAIHRSDSNRRNTQLADRIAMYTKILHDSNASAFYPEELKIAG